MSHPLLGDAYRYDEGSHQFVSARHQQLATILHEYDPSLNLCFIPKNQQETEEEKAWPWMVVSYEHGNLQLLSLWGDDDLSDNRILEWAFENDFNKHHPDEIFDRMEARNLATKLMEKKKIHEEYLEKIDKAMFLVRTPLHSARMDGKVFKG